MKKAIALLLMASSQVFAQTFPVQNLNLLGQFQINGSPGTAGYTLQSNGAASPSWVNLNGLYAPINSPAFTGVPTAPTATTGTNTTQVATTAFVQSQIAAVGAIPNLSGLTSTTTGTINAGSSSLTLGASNGFANGQGLMVVGAGPAMAIATPTGGTVTPIGTTGSTTYFYSVASIDAAGGVSIGESGFSTSSGNASLTCNGATENLNQVSWTAPSGNPNGYAVYRNIAGTYRLIGTTSTTTFYDCGSPAIASAPPWLPLTVPNASFNDWLLTTIASGGGTTSLTLNANATNSVASSAVIHDDSAAINAAINALPTNGGTVNLANTTYNIAQPINIGNGSVGVYSTSRGVTLNGATPSVSNAFWSYPVLLGTTLSWQGVPNLAEVYINGPLQGWSLNFLSFAGNNVSTFGLEINSGQFGISKQLYFTQCTYGILSQSVPVFGGNNTDDLHNDFQQIIYSPPNDGYSTAIWLHQPISGPDTDYNIFDDVMVGAFNVYQTAIKLEFSDSNVFRNVHLSNQAFRPIEFDYPSATVGPTANMFFGIDTGQNFAGIVNVGTPSGIPAPNWFYATMGANGGACPSIANLNCR